IEDHRVGWLLSARRQRLRAVAGLTRDHEAFLLELHAQQEADVGFVVDDEHADRVLAVGRHALGGLGSSMRVTMRSARRNNVTSPSSSRANWRATGSPMPMPAADITACSPR